MTCAFLFLCLSSCFRAVKVLRFLSVSDRKMKLVGTLGVKSKKFTIVFKSVKKNPKKVTEKQEFLLKTSF
ncbi:Uncharacterized protein FWK35_00039102 [Aphis craccivora]|uniref:Uncharacterized protein n=1 Tax=Aphis craccivora TaxID=307492 RepID=A0A6G0VXG6_APHCR|nr:Uncharacterized protein FWK35_00039102 [Aphis craccivora]